MAASTHTPGPIGSSASLLPRVCPVCQTRYPADFKVCPRDAARLEDAEGEADDPLIGTVLGDSLRIVRMIGEGGTARVYQARHTRLESKQFAVKVLHARYASNATVIARFQREAESAAAIGHPGIVDVYDVHRAPDGRPYLVTELLDGRDFGSLLKERGKVDVALAVRVARQLCRALSAAHKRGVVHRDMKPENVFLVGSPDNPTVKVLDFGISKLETEGAAQLTRTGMVVGTPAYMSPEQATGAKVDLRTDVYATGAILYRALTGKKPFEGGDAAEVLSSVMSVEPLRPRSLEPSIPEGLELLIQRAMAKQADERYANMDELDSALAPFDRTPREIEGKPGTLESKPNITEALVVDRTAHDARGARPTLVFGTLAAFLWIIACVVDALGSVLALGGEPNQPRSSSRLIALATGTVVIAVAPLVLWIRHLARIWPSTHQAVALAARVRRTTIAAIVVYAAAALGLRLVTGAGFATSLAPATPLAGVVLAALSLVTAGIVIGLARTRRRRPGTR